MASKSLPLADKPLTSQGMTIASAFLPFSVGEESGLSRYEREPCWTFDPRRGACQRRPRAVTLQCGLPLGHEVAANQD
jgi:hypothetical protein